MNTRNGTFEGNPMKLLPILVLLLCLVGCHTASRMSGDAVTLSYKVGGDAADITIDDCDDYLAYQSAAPLNISYTIESKSDAGPYSVQLRVKDQSESVVRTQDTTSLSVGPHQISWDGKLADGVTDAPAGQYTLEIDFKVLGGTIHLVNSHEITLVDLTPNKNHIALGGDDTILPLTPITDRLDYGELRLTVGPNYDYDKIQLTDELDNVLTLKDGQLTWDLSDPAVQVPSEAHVSIAGDVIPTADQVFTMSWWPDDTHAEICRRISLKPLRVTLKPSFNRLFLGMPNRIELEYEPATLSGIVTATVTSNSDKVRFWAERDMVTPVETLQWDLSDPIDAAKSIYAEGVSAGTGLVHFQLDYDE